MRKHAMSGAILGETTFAVVGLLFLLSAIRTFTSSLYMTLYGSVPNETVGAIALAVFAASILAVVVSWRATPRRGTALSATLPAARGLGGPGAWYAIAVLRGVGMAVGAGAVARGRPQRRVIALAALVLGAAVMWSHVPYLATLGAAMLAAGVIAASATLPDTSARP